MGTNMKIMRCLLFSSLAILFCLPALAQQTDINRYTLFTGFDYLISPARNLSERGFEGDFGVTAKPWLGLGVDFSAIGDNVISGAGDINVSETSFAPILTAHGIPLSLVPPVPFRSSTYVIAAGPQFYLRKFERVTFLVRPGFGAIHEVADLNLIQVAPVFGLLGIPAPSSHQTDTQWFIGAGGGFDLNLSRPVGWRFATDYVNTHLFSNLLTKRQNYWRFSTGPTFRFGHLSR